MINPKLLFAAIAILFTFLLVILTAFRISQPLLPKNSYSHSNNIENINLFLEATTSANKIFFDYTLPYPGILPNHPFYWLKMLRDKVQLSLIRNDIDLFYLYLHYADKRLISGLILTQENQKELAVSTITKAEKYLFQASNLLIDKINEGENSHLYHQIAKSYLKHDQLIKSNLDGFPDKLKQILENSLNNNEAYFQNHFSKYLDILKTSTNESSSSAFTSE